MMYGKYNVETLQNVIDTVNGMHRKQTELEKDRLQVETLETQKH